MKYWYGFQAIELDGTNPGRKCLSDEFDTYNEAKKHKLSIQKGGGMKCTAIYKARDNDEAQKQMENESFSKL